MFISLIRHSWQLAVGLALTRHSYGRGEAFYLGTLPDRTTLSDPVAHACGRAGIEFRTDVPPGVEVVRRGARRLPRRAN